ncbi:MAG: hypothetical protein EBX81_04055 [bacterium]|nr:hypothetical protein [Candidatus Aquidulcis sp.]
MAQPRSTTARPMIVSPPLRPEALSPAEAPGEARAVSGWEGLASVKGRVPRVRVADYTLIIRMGSPIRRILLVKPSALGDVCRSMPALSSLRRAFPDARIDWLVQDDFADAVRGHPDLSEAIAFPRRAWKRWWTPGSLLGVQRFCRGIRGNGYDLAVDLQGLFRSGLFLWTSGAMRRVGSG